MAIPPLEFSGEHATLHALLRQHNATTLAAAIIAASGRPHSIEQALEIVKDIEFSLYPAPAYGAYREWEKTKNQRLSKVHGPSV